LSWIFCGGAAEDEKFLKDYSIQCDATSTRELREELKAAEKSRTTRRVDSFWAE
jgi:hypothetical protein